MPAPSARPDTIGAMFMKPPAPAAPRRVAVSALVLLLALGVTLLAWHLMRVSLQASAVRAFEEHAARVESAMQDRMRGYEQVLHGGGGLFAASDRVTRDEWRRYVSAIRVREAYPGVRGVHVSLRVGQADLQAHVEAVRAEGFAPYAVRPEGARDEYYPIVWPEPMDERNQRAMGFDMFSEPVRRAAMEAARDSGKATISGKVTLAGETKDPVPGFIYYYPIYLSGQPVGDVAERRRAIRGFILFPLRMPDLMEGLLGQDREALLLEIYDGAKPSEAALMFDAGSQRRALLDGERAPLSKLAPLRFGGHAWTAYFEASPAYLASIDRSTPIWLLLAGLLMSATVTTLVWRLLRSEAIALSDAMHDGLTGLHNRRYLEASLKREEERARRGKATVSIVQFDLDHFKKINDLHGHAAGDDVLRRVGQVLREATRGEDIVCRYGGEELTLILPGASRGQAQARAQAIRARIAQLEIVSGGRALPHITLSGGLACFPEDGATLEAVLQRADQALLRAKREGRDRVLSAQGDDPQAPTPALP